MSDNQDLRKSTLKGGAYLFGRQMVSILLKLLGVMLITRILGPTAYGAYASAFGIYGYATLIGQAGVGVYLLRQEATPSPSAYGASYLVLAAVAVTLVIILQLCATPLAHWTNVAGFEPILRVVAFALPFQLMAVPATVRLERNLDYKRIAILEIMGQVCYYLLATPLVAMGFGPVTLAFAWILQQAVLFLVSHIFTRTRPTFSFDRPAMKGMVQYASTFSFANWLWQARMLVNPLVVAPVLGAHAVGIIGMTVGILEMLSLIKTIAWRLSVAVLARIQSDIEKLRRAVTEGMELQALAIGTIVLGFGWTGHFVVPLLFGARWAGVMDLYPYVALAYFTNSLFNMHSSVLSLLRRNGDVAIFHTVHIILFMGGAALMVPHLGMVGYGLAEVLALLSYVVIHVLLARAVGSPRYIPALVWWVGVALGLFWRELGVWVILMPFLALALPPSPKIILGYAQKILSRT